MGNFTDSSLSSEMDTSEEGTPRVKFLNMNLFMPIYHDGT